MQQFLCTGPKTGTPEFFREHLHAHESYFASYGDSFIFRGPIRSADGADNIGTALLLELPDRAAADNARTQRWFVRHTRGGRPADARTPLIGRNSRGEEVSFFQHQVVRRTVGRWVNDTYRRRPMIIPTVVEV